MKKIIKHLLNPFAGKYLRIRGEQRQINEWIEQGMPSPPVHAYKRSVIRSLQKTYHIDCFIESGTYKGEMVEAVLDSFIKIHSIELHEQLYQDVREKFKASGNVKLWHGDSGAMLKIILNETHVPALFWLDGHYSGEGTARGNSDTPIVNELTDIAQHSFKNGHVILIDDAHCFNGTYGYPTLEQLQKIIRGIFPAHSCIIEHNIVRILPQKS
jgi:hypothetical protein